MGLLDDFSLFELVGLGDSTGLELLFAVSALIGGILFVLYFFLLMVGGIATDVFDGIFGIDVDMGADASFKALTFQGIMAFMMFFGLAGLYTLKSNGPESVAVMAGAIAGGASMYGTGKLFELFIDLQQDGTTSLSEAIGSKGQTYLRISADGVGQVTVDVNGAQRTYNAKSVDGAEISTGAFIEVTDVIGEVLVVKRI
jgi:membrane-bound ClpP family serine protease|tara:strand:+ start:4981 stop:5577 length:597 start_codon:yes stop_codon:yes gene_type:complete